MNRAGRFASPFLLVLIAWLSSVSAPYAAAPPVALTGTVSWVYDTDTLKVDPHDKVRLLGIDAPEKNASDRDRTFTKLGIAPGRLRPVHGEGLAWLIRNVKGQRVTLTLDRTMRDRHGRLLAYVRLPDGRLLNRLLLEEGLAIVYRRFDFQLKADFLAAEAAAKQRGLGLWARQPASRPANQSNSLSCMCTPLPRPPSKLHCSPS